MPREQPPEQEQYQKGLNPDVLVSDDEDLDEGDETESDDTDTPPVESDQRLAQDQSQQRPADNIEQIEDDEADDEADYDADESDQISQRP